MDFELSEEQQLLKDMVGRFMQDRYDFEKRKKYMAEPGGFSEEIWAAYAEQGLLAVPFAEEDGGIGGGPVDLMIVMEEMGKALALEPYLSTVVIGGSILRTTATPAQRSALAEEIIGGACKLAFAHSEPKARYELAHVETKAAKSGDGYTLDGAKTLVMYGGVADKLIVSARVSGGTTDEAGVGLFLVDPKADGVAIRDYPTQDGLRAAEVTLTGAAAELLGDTPDSMAAIRQAADEAIAALCAEAAGALAGGARAFVTVGRQELCPFLSRTDVTIVARTIEKPEHPLPERIRLVLDRPPYSLEHERAALARYRIDVLVTKNSGGAATAAKLQAARDRGIEVVMVDRPGGQPPADADDVAACLTLIRRHLDAR